MTRMTRTFLVALPVLATVVGCKPSDDRSARSARRPNIVWLSIESLRSDHIGCYGYDRDTSPAIDAFAAENTLFENAYSVTSWTLTSHASMFTGLYPSAHKVIWPKDRLGASYTTIAEILSAAGYQTAAVVSGEYLKKKHRLDQGFEIYDDSPIRKPGTKPRDDITNPKMEKSLKNFLLRKRDEQRPFFLFAYFWDPHHHYVPPPPYDSMFVPPGAEPIEIEKIKYAPFFKLGKHISQKQLDYVVAQYDGEIRWTDEHVGRLFRLLRDLDLWDNTAIIVTADHGEEFFDHGHNSHKNSLYVESLHVPLIVKFPGRNEARKDDRVVNLIDLFPTILDLAGCAEDHPHNGHSLLDPPRTEPVFFDLQTLWTFTNRRTKESWREAERWQAVLDGPYKLIHIRDVEHPDRPDRWELYDESADPQEQHPIEDAPPEKLAELRGRLEQWNAAMEMLGEKWEAGGTVDLTPQEEERLRSLGYLP